MPAVELHSQRRKPIIQTNGTQLDLRADECIEALQEANDPPSLFMHGGTVVDLRTCEKGIARIHFLNDAQMVERLAVVAEFVRMTEKGAVDANPSRELAATVRHRLARVGGLPFLRDLVRGPVMLTNGRVLTAAGYDAESGIFLAPSEPIELPAVPEEPSSADVAKAVEIILEPLVDFPFRGDADRASAVVATLTLVLRGLIDAPAPLYMIDATALGTGKGKLADVSAIIATGSPAPRAILPSGRYASEEQRKQITTWLADRRAVLCWDNIKHRIGGVQVEALLTADEWTDRILGASEAVRLANRTLWVATANNAEVGGDMVRRLFWCRLDAGLPRPWEGRSFKHPHLEAYVRARRADLLWACFVLARNWISLGKPKPSTPLMASFERWSCVCGGILECAGIGGFLANLDEVRATADPEAERWTALIEWAHVTMAEAEWSIEALVNRMVGPEAPELPDEMPARGDPTFRRALGTALNRRADCAFELSDGRIVRLRRGKRSKGRRHWRLEQ